MKPRCGALALFASMLAACGGIVTVDGTSSSSSTTTTGAGGAGATSATSSTATGSPTGAGGNATSSGVGGSGGGVDCDPGAVLCNSPTPACPVGEAPSVEGSCWGECVPILDCATVPSCDGCAAFCASYTGFGVEYRCVAPTVECSALACSCLGPYFCVDPYDVCIDGGGQAADVGCECTNC